MAASALIQEPTLFLATKEVASDDLGNGPQGLPMRREWTRAFLDSDRLGDSMESGAAGTAPPAGVFVTITPAAGTWEIQATVSVNGDMTDLGNVELKKAATVLAILANGLSPIFRKTLDGSTAVTITVIANGAPGSQYAATLVARQVA